MQAAEQLARSAAEALEASRITTVTAESVTPAPTPERSATWRPQHPTTPASVPKDRTWARRTLPEILTRQTRQTRQSRRDLHEDMDLVFTELFSNAVRHGGGLCEAQLSDTGEHLRLTAADNDPSTVPGEPADRVYPRQLPWARSADLLGSVPVGQGHNVHSGRR